MRRLLSLAALLSLIAAPVPALSQGSGAPTDARVASLLAASRVALGGDALQRAGVMQITGKDVITGLRGTGTIWVEILGHRYADSYSTPPVDGGDGFDGHVAWLRDGSGLVWVDGGTAGHSSEVNTAFLADDALWAPHNGGARVAWGGAKHAGGVAYESLVVTPPSSAVPIVVWFDRKTHLPARAVQTIGPFTTTSYFSDYRSVGGVKVPYRTRSVGSDGNVNESMVTKAVRAHGAVARLTKPASHVHDYSIAGGASQTVVPFDFIGGHVYLTVKLNGKGPYRFVYDTGAANYIDPAVAKEIGISGRGALQGSGVGSETEQIGFAKVASLQFGAATVKDQLFQIGPIRAGFGVSMGSNVDGLIGFEVLSRFVTTFDYGKHRLTFTLPQAAKRPAGSRVVPIVLNGTQPQFACSINGVGSQCTVDTGARQAISLFTPFVVAHPQIVPAAISAVGVDGYGLGGPAMGRLGRLQSLGIGPFTLPDIIADFTAQSKGAYALPFLAGNVGARVWQRFAITFDYGKQTMALVPNANFGRPDFYERAGLWLLNRDGKFVVADVRPGTSSAMAGILKDDTIASVDGKPASSMGLQGLRDLFLGASGTVVQLDVVEKDGTERTISLTLRDFV